MSKFIYALAAALVVCLAATVYADNTSRELENGVVRLHIIASSDSDTDQVVKLCVRDALLKRVRDTGMPKSVAEIKAIADGVLKENGLDYTSSVQTGVYRFPQKTYKDTVFPCGEYNAVRVILGNGGGKNWWCVMYPPLCFDESIDGEMSEDGKEKLKTALDNETYTLVTQKPVIRFKIVELINELRANVKAPV